MKTRTSVVAVLFAICVVMLSGACGGGGEDAIPTVTPTLEVLEMPSPVATVSAAERRAAWDFLVAVEDVVKELSEEEIDLFRIPSLAEDTKEKCLSLKLKAEMFGSYCDEYQELLIKARDEDMSPHELLARLEDFAEDLRADLESQFGD